MKPLRLEILFGSKDKLSPALRLLVSSSKAAASASKQARDELKKLNDQQKQIDGYIKQKKATEDSAKALQDIQTRIKTLRQEMARNPSDALSREFDKATTQARKLKEAHSQNQIKLQQLRTGLNQAGYSTHNLAQQQTDLTRRITAANSSIESQKNKLANLSRLQQSHNRLSTGTQKMAMYGVGAAGTGVAALYQMRKPIEESKRLDVEEHRIGSLGLGKKSTQEAIQYAKAMKTFGTSTLDNMTLVRDGITAFADVHHAKMVAPMLAKMKFANQAMYGEEHGAENEKKFMDMLKVIEMRNGLKNEAAFKEQANMIQQVITATGGRVQAEEWLNLIKTGGIAAKGIDNKAFYYKLEPLVQEMSGYRVGTAMMSAYANLYQGRTTKRVANHLDDLGLIADKRKVHNDKVGQIAYLDIGAIKGAALFKKDQFAWMEQVLLPTLKAKGITKESDVVDAIGSIFSNRTASQLFSTMYLQRENIHKNMRLNEGADNIDQLDKQAKNTTAGKEVEAKAKLHDAYLQFGQTILPIYTQALVMASNAMQVFTGWMQKNPALAKTLGTGLLIAAAGLIAIGGTLVLLSPLLLSLLSLRLVMSTLGIQGNILGRSFSLLAAPFRLLSGQFSILTGRGLALANMLRGQLSAAWLASHPKNLIAGLKRLPSLIQSVIMRSWLLIKTMSSGLYQSFITASQGAWHFANTLIRNTANSLRVYIVMVYSTVRANGLLGTSKIVLRNAALGLWAALRGGTVGLFSLLASGANLAAQSFLFLSRAILFNPIGLAITAIATAAFLIYRYWQPIKAFFSGFWQGFTEGIAPLSASFGSLFQILGNALLPLQPIWSWIIAAFKTAFVWVGQLFQPFQATKQQLDSATSSGRAFGGWLASLVNTVASLVGKFFNFGANIVGGLINGIKSMFAPLKSTWETIVSWLPDRLRKKMDIHSPSRVMAGLGHFIMQGINVGLDQGFPSLKNKFNTVLDVFQGNVPQVDIKSRLSNALSHMAQSNTPREVFDPIASIQSIVTKVKAVQLSPASSKASRPIVIEGDTITVQIHAQQGHSVQDLYQQFEQFLQRREREKQAQARARFFDDE